MAVIQYKALTAPQIKELSESNKAIAVLPIGSIEQHGPHLPVGTDSYIGNKLLDVALNKTTEDMTYIILPEVPYSCSIEHSDCPGTITLSSTGTISLLKEIGASLIRTGLTNLIFITGHGGNEHILEVAARELRIEGMHTFCVQLFPIMVALGADQADVHAGDMETSVMLEINESLVKKEAIEKKFVHQKKPGISW